MGYRSLELKLPLGYQEEELKRKIARELRLKNFTFQIEKKSLDARKKERIFWSLRLQVISDELGREQPPLEERLQLPRLKSSARVLVVGSGPAGFFAAYALAEAGIKVTLIEQGSEVEERYRRIRLFEAGGALDLDNNYSFGEGGAGTFSDGKLTSRSKTISLERRYIFDLYRQAGAPEEILYLTHPHLGSDNLRHITYNLRQKFQALGGEILFNCRLERVQKSNGQVTGVSTNRGELNCDYLIIAGGHSSYQTYRELLHLGVRFKIKTFAIGFRAEHPQELINLAQWGHRTLPSVKAAEYRLSSNPLNLLPVYSFCMCPGGQVVQAACEAGQSVVNGMSNYARDGQNANAAVVAAFNPEELLQRSLSPEEALEWLKEREESFYQATGGYNLPAQTISSFISGKESALNFASSYPFKLQNYPLAELMPEKIVRSLQEGLKEFGRKLRGYSEEGILLGLESKTSAPLQNLRDEQLRAAGFTNLWLAGEGSGHAGGIISSGADGLRCALALLELESKRHLA